MTMDISNIKPEYRDELKGIARRLVAWFLEGRLTAEQLSTSQERLFAAYLRVSVDQD